MHASKRSLSTHIRAGAKKAKVATKHAAATEPAIPDTTPLANLLNTLQLHQEKVQPIHGNVVHWFRSDLRLEDNRALHAASEKAKQNNTSLIALFVVSPQVIFFNTVLLC